MKPSYVRFDQTLTLKEDYDFTLAHIRRYGRCLRFHKYLFTFQHYTNHGGAVHYRTRREEQRNIQYLQKKWGNMIRLNPKRINEILLNSGKKSLAAKV